MAAILGWIAALVVNVVAQGYSLMPGDTLPIRVVSRHQNGSLLVSDHPAEAHRFRPLPCRTHHAEIPMFAGKSELVYCSNGDAARDAGEVPQHTKFSSFGLFRLGRVEGGYYSRVRRSMPGFATRRNEGPGSIGGNQGVMVYQKGKGSEAGGQSSLYLSKRRPNRWSAGKRFWFCSKAFNYCQPAISLDGKTVVFAANLPEGEGGMDLYVSRLFPGGWCSPANLGPGINTEDDEGFPTLDKQGNLFFSTKGRSGPGGWDLCFAAKSGAKWNAPWMLPAPFNSAFDDIQLVWESDGILGYFASNRDSAWGYEITEVTRWVDVEFSLHDALTGGMIPSSVIEIENTEGKKSMIETDASGIAHYFCRSTDILKVSATHTNFKTRNLVIATSSTSNGDKLEVDLAMEFDRKFELYGSFVDAGTRLKIVGGRIRTINLATLNEAEYLLDSTGDYRIGFARNERYAVIFEADGYVSKVAEVSTLPPNERLGKQFDVLLNPGDELLLQGQVVDFQSGTPLQGVTLRVLNNLDQRLVGQMVSEEDGRFWIVIPRGRAFECSVIASLGGYFSSRLDVEASTDGKRAVFLQMKLAEYGTDKVVKRVYFDYGKKDLVPLSKKDLNEIHYFMTENPEAVLEVGAHTDARGSESFNLRLSQGRAEEIVRFVVEKEEVPLQRLRAKGYGESRLANHCGNTSDCTEEGHAENRRAEIKVVRLDE